jgi:hypothetical protein
MKYNILPIQANSVRASAVLVRAVNATDVEQVHAGLVQTRWSWWGGQRGERGASIRVAIFIACQSHQTENSLLCKFFPTAH